MYLEIVNTYDFGFHSPSLMCAGHTTMFTLNINRHRHWIIYEIKAKLYTVHSYSDLTLRHYLVLEVKR